MHRGAVRTLTTLLHTVHPHGVHEVALHRPSHMNALSSTLFDELGSFFTTFLAQDPSVRCVLLTGGTESKHFTCGLDLHEHGPLFAALQADKSMDVSRKTLTLHAMIQRYQASFTAVAACRVPVIAAVHGGVIGGGLDLIAATDIRLCTESTVTQAAEVHLGLAPDLGTLQRFPPLVNSASWAREVLFTGRRIPSQEAVARGLYSTALPDLPTLRTEALLLATSIAQLSPVGIKGTKAQLSFSGGGTAEGLAYAAALNASLLQNSDIVVNVMKKAGSPLPVFPDAP
jgi:enoyl-CoA hydratase/carnithine racemase